MKIYTTKIKESWIIDRIKDEWEIYQKKYVSKIKLKSDIIWVIAPWAINDKILINSRKKIVYSVYHIEDLSKDSLEIAKLKNIEQFVDAFHVISIQTKQILSELTTKPIYFLPLWVNQNIWFEKNNKIDLRKKYGFSANQYLIGSFQRDTEGSDLISPKLVKGPDIFIKIVKKLYEQNKNITVVLTGTRRQFIISELKKSRIPYKYFEMSDFNILNDLYNILDLYLVTSRLEGGPQAIVECGLIKTPIISTDVGIAQHVLPAKSIFSYKNIETFFECSTDINLVYENVSHLQIPDGMNGYVKMFQEVYES